MELLDGGNTTLAGLKETEMPEGADADNETVPEKPLTLARLIEDDTEAPGYKLKEEGVAEMLKSQAGFTATITVAEWIITGLPLLVAVNVTG